MKGLIVHKTIRKTWAWMLVTIMIVTLAIPTCINALAGSTNVEITKSLGWLESAYAEWSPVTNATGYSVYYKSATAADSSYTKIDDMLIRKYDGYYRADAVGLSAGDYQLKVVPLINGSEDVSKASITQSLTVSAHTREGFAFSNQSTAKSGSGGYSDNGTVPSNAQIVYVSESNKNTVTLSVITGSSGTTTTCTGIGAILTAREKKKDTRPLIIRIIGKVTAFESGNDKYMQIKNTSNITVEGIGEDATAYGWGILLREATNIEVRNLGIMMFPDDGISLDTNNNNIWIHNNDIFYGAPGSDADQEKGDGSCDVKSFSNYVTVSYNHFWDSGKCSLCGMSDSKEFFVTYHHNWYDHSDSRHPRIRVGTIHIYNNYFDGNAKYGVGVTKGSSAFVENNYFRNCKYPMLSSLQGSDIFGDADGTFSGEAGGMIKSYGNTIIGATRFVDQSFSSTDFDAITTLTRSETVPGTYKTVSGGTTYNNFDTASTMYQYSVDSPDAAKVKVEKYAGRINGGDFKWQFNNSIDDLSYDINSSLKSSLLSYTSKVLAIGGNAVNGGPIATTEAATQSTTQSVSQATTQAVTQSTTSSASQATTQTATQNTTQVTTQQTTQASTVSTTQVSTETQANISTITHNFTKDGKVSSFFTIVGNLSTSKGTVNYKNLELTQCLKIESTTSISFASGVKGQLTMVFLVGSSAPNIKVNGTKYSSSDGIIKVEVSSGTTTITKADSNNLYYLIFEPDNPTQASTVEPTQSSTVAPTESTTVAPTQSTTAAPTQSTTVAPTQGMTVTPTQGSTAAETQGTTQNTTTAQGTTQNSTETSTQHNDNNTVSTGLVTNLRNINDQDYKTVIYCSPDALASGSGTSNSPMTLEAAIQLSKDINGVAILLKEGTYSYNYQLTIPYGNNGSQSAYKVLKPMNGAKVTLDFSSQPYGDTSTNARGLQMEGNYWYVYGITVTGSADNGIFVAGSNNVIERCITRANRDSGLQISRRNSTITDKAQWPSNNYILNCTSFDNMDPATQENADGFASKLTCGEGNVFDGCISYCNIDDGWDLYAKTATGSIGVVTIRNCIAFKNGTLTNGTTSTAGDRNGFKLGGSNGEVPTPHLVLNCMAFSNGKDGFTDNGNGAALSITNCTSYNNSGTNFNFYRTKGGIYKNLLTISGKNTDKFVGTIQDAIYYNSSKYYFIHEATAVTSGLKIGTIITAPSSADFISMTGPSETSDIDSVYRNQDGTVNTNGYLIMKDSSNFSSLGAKFGTNTNTLTLNVATKGNAGEEPTVQTTQAATQVPTTQAAQTTQAATQVPTQVSTVAPTQSTTVASTEATTAGPTQSTTVASTEATTAGPTQSTTVATTDVTTAGPTQSTTVAPTQSVQTTQVAILESTTQTVSTRDHNMILIYCISIILSSFIFLVAFIYKKRRAK